MTPNRLKAANAKTLANYYSSVNVGDFMGAAQTLAPDVIFSIPGDPTLLPFSGKWVGREKVLELFHHFIDAFYIVHMDETCTITSEDEIISFNDESFKVKTTDRYYRVGVVHHITFNEDGLIKSLINMHDTAPAVQAFAGKAAIAQPIFTPSQLTAKIQLSDMEATLFVKKFYEERLWEKGEVSDYLADSVNLIAPGNPDCMPFSGIWIGTKEVLQFMAIHNRLLTNRTITIENILANNDVIAVVLEESGTIAETEEEITIKRYDLIQLAETHKIGSITIYADTYPLSI